MTTLIAAFGLLVAVAAAVRSTWSPCGRSMMSTITPIGERGRGHRYGATACWFVLGGVLGGLCLGGLGAAAAVAIGSVHPSSVALGSVAAAAALVGAAFDVGLAGLRLPGTRRQVNERWLDRFRSGIYGVGFGWQIGIGLATFVMTAGVYLVIVLGALTCDPWVAVALGAAFGTVRGMAVLLTRHVRSPEQLRAFHRRFDALGDGSRRAMVLAQLVSAVAITAVLWPPAALLLAAGAAVATLCIRVRRRPAEGPSAGHRSPSAGATP